MNLVYHRLIEKLAKLILSQQLVQQVPIQGEGLGLIQTPMSLVLVATVNMNPKVDAKAQEHSKNKGADDVQESGGGPAALLRRPGGS